MMKTYYPILLVLFLATLGCRPKGTSENSSATVSTARGAVVAVSAKSNAIAPTLRQFSQRSIRKGVECKLTDGLKEEVLQIVPSSLAKITSPNGLEYFIVLKTPMAASRCSAGDENSDFDYRSFFIARTEFELISNSRVTPVPEPEFLPSTDDLKSQRAEALARDIERRRSGGGKSCGLTSFGSRGCWACVGWAMTDSKIFPSGLGSGADASPNGFLRATAAARARKAADGTININGVRFLSLKARYASQPSFAPRGSILFCNTSAEGHAAIITNPANEMRSDVIEIIGANWRQSLCWERVEEILFPLD